MTLEYKNLYCLKKIDSIPSKAKMASVKKVNNTTKYSQRLFVYVLHEFFYFLNYWFIKMLCVNKKLSILNLLGYSQKKHFFVSYNRSSRKVLEFK